MPRPRTLHRTAAAALAATLVAGCSTTDVLTRATAAVSTDTTAAAAVDDLDASATVFDASTVHDIDVVFDEAEYEALLETYSTTGEKDWISATVTIDGVTYEDVGLRLKGNSSLRGLGGDAGGRFGGPGGAAPGGAAPGGIDEVSGDDPAALPWLIRLDKYVDGQSHQGVADLVVRSNNSATSLNEAVALALLGEAGLATQDAMAVRFSVNGGDEQLRLVIEHPDDVWMEDEFGTDGQLYKAESTGDYSYRGDDPEAYVDVFDQEAGEDDLSPLTDFLQWLNESDDATFAAELDQHLDVDAFATYLAMQEVVQNFDDIDGPGNNSYLHFDSDTGLMTVVAWDHNLAFGDAGFGIGGGRGGAVGAPGVGAGGFGGGGGPSQGNILSERFLAVDGFAALVEEREAELTAELVDSGLAEEVVESWVAVLEEEASDLVDPGTIRAEADAIIASL